MSSKWKSKKKKAHDADSGMDIISNLPRDVIYCIMKHIPLADATRMSLLSRKWFLFSKSIPQIVIDDKFCRDLSGRYRYRHDARYGVSDIVNKLLLDHLGSVVNFSLDVSSIRGFPDINHWLRFLSKNKVKELCLKFNKGSKLVLNSELFSCVKLESLSIQNCILESACLGHLRNLSNLLVNNVEFRNPKFDHLISTCPLLENLSVIECTSTNFELTKLVAPKLRHLVMIDNVFTVESVGNLSSVSVTYSKKPTGQHKTLTRKLFKALTNSIKLEKLCLGYHTYRVFIAACQHIMTFEQLRILKLTNIDLLESNDLDTMIRAIQMCPNIERLNISVNRRTSEDVQMLHYTSPYMALNYLRWAKVRIRIGSTLDLKLIEFLLACATLLESLSFSFTTCAKLRDEVNMLRQLIQFRRASPKAVLTGLDTLTHKSNNYYDSTSDDDSTSEDSDEDSTSEDSDEDSP